MARLPTLIGAAALSLAVAACGSSSGGTPSGSSSTNPPKAQDSVAVGTTNLGSVLVDNRGRTLYELSSDPSNKSTCTGACASVWAPVEVAGTQPTAGAGVTGTLGALTRSDGTKQVTIAGHPLYTYSGDSATGEVNGQQITSYGGTWYVLSANGTPVTSGNTTPTASPSSGDGGYHY